MALLLNEYPYSDYQKINLDWLLDLGNKLKADAASGEFDGERGKGVYGITTIYPENNYYYAYKSGDIGVGDFIIGYGAAAGDSTLYFMKVTSVVDNELRGDSIIRITGPQGIQGPQGEPGEGGLTEAMKQALLQLARKVAYIDGNGQTYYADLYNAFYPPAGLVSISAVFTQGSNIIYDTDNLSVLRQYLTVTAHYDDSTSAVVTAYTLSGTLTAGNSTITVSYGGQSTTFVVAVTHYEEPEPEPTDEAIYNWNFKQSFTDSVANVTAVPSNESMVITSDGVAVNTNQAIMLTPAGGVSIANKTFEIDMTSDTMTAQTSHSRVFCVDSTDNNTASGAACLLVYRANNGWSVYSGSAWSNAIDRNTYPITFFDGKTIRLYVDSNLNVTLSYATIGSSVFTTIGTFNLPITSTYASGFLVIGGLGGNYTTGMVIGGVRIYEGSVE